MCIGAEMPGQAFRVFIKFIRPVTPEIRRYSVWCSVSSLLPPSQYSIMPGYLEEEVL